LNIKIYEVQINYLSRYTVFKLLNVHVDPHNASVLLPSVETPVCEARKITRLGKIVQARFNE